MDSILPRMFSSSIHRRKPADLPSRMTRQIRADDDNTEHRTLSGPPLRRSHQGATEDTLGNTMPDPTAIPRAEASQSNSRFTIRTDKHKLPVQVNENIFHVKSELKEAMRLNVNFKKQVECTERNLTTAIQQRDALQVMMTEYEQHEQSKDRELVQARADIRHLEECLDDCKERIFNIQPLEHMTDSEIADQYRSLCESISDWTDNQFGDCDNPLSRLPMIMGKGPGKPIHKYLAQERRMEVIRTYPTAGYTMITSFIQRQLYLLILQERICYPSLDAKCESFVKLIVGGMSQNEPRRGEDVIRIWLTEVQRALSSSPQMKATQGAYLTFVCSQVANALASLLPADQIIPFRAEELRKLFTEAADLAKNTRVSTTAYRFSYDCSVGEPLFMDELCYFEVINEDNEQLIRKSDMFRADQDGKIGQKLCVVHPALVREGKNRGKDIILVKATILCNFDRPVTRQKKTQQDTADGAVAAAQHARIKGDDRT